MRLNPYLIVLSAILLSTLAIGQKTTVKNTTVKPPAVKTLKPIDYGDSFTNELAKELDELMKMISVPVQEFDKMVISGGVKREFSRVVYPSTHRLPGTSSAFFDKQNVKWHADGTGEASWNWYGELMRQYKENDLDKKAAMEKKYQDALVKIYGKHKTEWSSFKLPWGNVIDLDSKGYKDSTALVLTVSFKQESLAKSDLKAAYIDHYKRVLYTTPDKKVFEQALTEMYGVFEQSSFSDEDQYQALLPLYLELAGGSQRRAYGIYINYFNENVSRKLKDAWPSSQRDNMKKLAEEYLANYEKPGYNFLAAPVKPPEPIVKTQPQQKTNNNPCSAGQKTLEFNAMIETRHGVTRTFTFDCAAQTFLVAYINSSSGKLQFGYMPLEEVQKAKRSQSDIYICSNCKGSGGVQGASYTHAYGFAWVREYPTDCKACWGKGFCPNGRCNQFGQ